ncbi:MFS transporter [Glaciimonas soli]|uniref:MFS transporter n=1 Tax=Glaciimonas soli TaxID=2590999 RepID=A0A843YIM8_9BURK|nr:MFS transporter [Glaciimonas soli]MQQ99214.1 MFS transporter [Glaciimonas soli]
MNNVHISPWQRWGVLAIFCAALMMVQVFWYDFAPILTFVSEHYGVSELFASLLILVFPVMSILVSAPAGRLIDNRGYRLSLLIGTGLMAACSMLRVIDNFWVLVLAQTGVAIATPFIVTPITVLASDWFDARDEAKITGICAIAIFAGLALAMTVSPVLFAAFHLAGSMAIHAAAAFLLFLLTYLFVHHQQRQSATPAAQIKKPAPLKVRGNIALLVILIASFLIQGCFNAATTWLEAVWSARGFGIDDAGFAMAAVVGGGIVGAMIIPALATKSGSVLGMITACLLPSALLIYPLFAAGSVTWGIACGALLGFFWLPLLPLSLTVIDEAVPKTHAGIAAGLFWTVGNAGVLAMTVLFERIKNMLGWPQAVIMLILCMLAVLCVLLRFAPAMRRHLLVHVGEA